MPLLDVVEIMQVARNLRPAALHDSIEAAIQREKQMKEWRRNWKLRQIIDVNPEWKDLAAVSVDSIDNGDVTLHEAWSRLHFSHNQSTISTDKMRESLLCFKR